MNKHSILVVEDDRAVQKLITTTLDLQGYAHRTASDGEQALMELVTKQPDVLILDLGLPDTDGLSIIKKVREWSTMPIIIVSARSEDQDKIQALDAGADDYLTKPFSVEELLARLRVMLRRVNYDRHNAQANSSIFLNGPLKIDYSSGSVWLGEEEIHFTPIEYKLLCLLSKNVGKVLTHNYILYEVWGKYYEEVSVLRVFMASVRKKIDRNRSAIPFIQTRVGVGYRMMNVEYKENGDD
ncbi:sensor histidine kinase [Alkalibacterium sp. AK22]|uniref:response regulator n=1 Tax=Alkalibacterium sp. AK22 TaxID=1229520 RepID=UPI00044D7C44|nr:response regulator transcription factor [Alkalibacterium sp. AK22]EXJ24348.1 sensor histidine kinase [Alkalibacterium sp. AK22]